MRIILIAIYTAFGANFIASNLAYAETSLVFEGIPEKQIVIEQGNISAKDLNKQEAEEYKLRVIKTSNRYNVATRENKEVSLNNSGSYKVFNSKDGAIMIKVQDSDNSSLTSQLNYNQKMAIEKMLGIGKYNYFEMVHQGLKIIIYFGTTRQ